jgi:hypothetical protein
MQSSTKSCWKHFCEMSYVLSSICYGFKIQQLIPQISMQVLRTPFLSRLISRFRDINWLAHSPDLAVPDDFLWGYVKSKVHETCPANTDDLKARIRECIQGIPQEILRVMIAFPSQLQSVFNDMVIIQMICHGHELYLPVLKFFHFALKCYFTSKTVRCFLRTLYFRDSTDCISLKTRSCEEYPVPKGINKVPAFLGLTLCYRHALGHHIRVVHEISILSMQHILKEQESHPNFLLLIFLWKKTEKLATGEAVCQGL